MIDNELLKAKSDAGIDVHLSDDEAKEFQAAAKVIDPQRYFTIYGCQECINTLVKFVFTNQGTPPALEFSPAKAKKIIKNIPNEEASTETTT